MQVVLLKDVKGVGRKNEVRNVADGYAKNFLFPKGLAKEASKGALSEIQSLLQANQSRAAEYERIVREIGERTGDKPIQLHIKAGDRGEVFGSVTKIQIMDKLESEMKLDKRISAEADIKLEKPIRELGRHRVPFRIGQAKGEVEIEVIKEEQSKAQKLK